MEDWSPRYRNVEMLQHNLKNNVSICGTNVDHTYVCTPYSQESAIRSGDVVGKAHQHNFFLITFNSYKGWCCCRNSQHNFFHSFLATTSCSSIVTRVHECNVHLHPITFVASLATTHFFRSTWEEKLLY